MKSMVEVIGSKYTWFRPDRKEKGIQEIAQALKDAGFGNVDEVRTYYSEMIDKEYVHKDSFKTLDEGEVAEIISKTLFNESLNENKPVRNLEIYALAHTLSTHFKPPELSEVEVDVLRVHEIIDNNMPTPEILRNRDWEYEDIEVIAKALAANPQQWIKRNERFQ